MGFVVSRVESLLLGLTPGKFLIFPVRSSSPQQGTETVCFIYKLELR